MGEYTLVVTMAADGHEERYPYESADEALAAHEAALDVWSGVSDAWIEDAQGEVFDGDAYNESVAKEDVRNARYS